MDAIKKQASKLREQVAKQQQAILRTLGQMGHESVMFDETDQECHLRLQKFYTSTRVAKHYQKDIVRGVEGLNLVSKRQMEITRKLAEDCCKYGIENQSDTFHLATAASNFGTSHASMEDHRETMIGILSSQVCEPLRVSVAGAPLEDARHLTHQYDKVRQEVEAQGADVLRRKSKYTDASVESLVKLKNAEAKLNELKSSMSSLGREATEAMMSVEDQQQQITLQKLLTMVHAEKSYHHSVVTILEKLYSEMILEEQLNESSLQSAFPHEDIPAPSVAPSVDPSVASDMTRQSDCDSEEARTDGYFIGKVIHSFDAEADGELGLSIDDYVIVRQVTPNGWSEGEYKGKCGWFPSAYIVKEDKVPVNKIS